MKTIQVSKEVWQILRNIKNYYKLKHFNEVIKWLLVSLYNLDKNYIEQYTNESGQIKKQLFIDKKIHNTPSRYRGYNSNHAKIKSRYPDDDFSIDKNTLNILQSDQYVQIRCKNCNSVVNFNWDGAEHGQILCPFCKKITFW
jgi:hypothetical protein